MKTMPESLWPETTSAVIHLLSAILVIGHLAPAWAARPPKPPPPPPPAAPYTYLYLGGLGGSSGNALAINNLGQVVGQSRAADGLEHPFIVVPQDTNSDGKPDLWNPTGTPLGLNPLMTDLGMPPGVEHVVSIYVLDINDLGQAVGHCRGTNSNGSWWETAWVVAPTDANSDGKPEWYWNDGTGANALMMPLWQGGGGGDWTAINNLGQIVGSGAGEGFLVVPLDADGDGRPDTWFQDANGDGLNDLIVDLGQAFDSLGRLVNLQPRDINDAGQIVGSIPARDGGARDTPFRLTPRQTPSGPVWFEDAKNDGENDLIVRLQLPQSDRRGFATVVNASGTTAGIFETSRDTWYHAILWKADASGVMRYTDLGVPNGEDWIESRGINDRNQVVGRTILYGAQARIRSYSGWLWQNGVMTDVRTLMDKSAELAGQWMAAAGINNAGMMVGWTGGPSYPWIAVPIP